MVNLTNKMSFKKIMKKVCWLFSKRKNAKKYKEKEISVISLRENG